VARNPLVIEIAINKMMKERSSETLPMRRFGTTLRIALSGGSVRVKTISESNRSRPLGRQSRAKIATYSRTNLAIKIKTYRFKSDEIIEAIDDTVKTY
jgi:hypothetical protein